MSAPPAPPAGRAAASALEADAAAPLLLAQVTSPLIAAQDAPVDEPDTLASSRLSELVADVHRCDPSDYAALANVASSTHRVLLDHRSTGRVFDGFGDCGGFLIVVQLLAALGSTDATIDDKSRLARAQLLTLALSLVADAITFSAANLHSFCTTVTWAGLRTSLGLAAEAHDAQLAAGVVGGLIGLAIGDISAGMSHFDHVLRPSEGAQLPKARLVVVHPGAVAAAFELATVPALRQALLAVLDTLIDAHPRNARVLARTPIASQLLFAEAFPMRHRILAGLLADGIGYADVRKILESPLEKDSIALLRTVSRSAHHPRAMLLDGSGAIVDALPCAFPSPSAMSTGYSLAFSVRVDCDSSIVQIGTHGHLLRVVTVEGALCIDQGGSNTRTKLTRAVLTHGKWHTVVITHARAAPGARSTLHAYIDGHRANSVPVMYPATMPEPTPLVCGTRGTFALGPLLLTDGALPSSLPVLLHELSPQYAGNFQSALARFLTPSGRAIVEERLAQLDERGARRGSRALESLRTVLHGAAPDVFPLGRFYVHLDAAHTRQTRYGAVIINKAYATAEEAIDSPSGHARLVGVPTLSVPLGIGDGVWRAGGTTALVLAVRHAESPADLTASVCLLLELLSRSWRLSEDAERSKCYEMLAAVLRDKADMIQPEALSAVVHAAGTEPLANTALYRAVLLNAQIWPRTQPAVQQAYLDHFGAVCTPRNTSKLGKLPVLKRLVMFVRSATDISHQSVRSATSAAVACAFSVSGVQVLVLHLAAVLAGSYDLGAALETPTVRTTEDMERRKRAPSTLTPTPGATLALLHGLVDSAGEPSVLSRLARTVSAKWLLLLLRPGASKSYAIPALELIGMLLGESSFARKFYYAGGLRLLERTLPLHWSDTSVLPWLWTLFFAEQRPTRATLYATFAPRRSWPNESALIRHGAVLRTILACIGKGMENICASPLRRRRSLPELHEAGDIATAETAVSLVQDSVALISRHAAHPEVHTALLQPQSVLHLLAAILPWVCEQRQCALADVLLDTLSARLLAALLQTGSLAPLTIVHTSMPVPDPVAQSQLCTRVYHRLLQHTIHAMRIGPVHRATLSMLCSLLELVSNESLRDAPLQQGIFSLGGFILAKAEVSRLAASTREQLLLSLQRNVLHAYVYANSLACSSRGIRGADAFAFCAVNPQLLSAKDGVFVECVLHGALRSSSRHAAHIVKLIGKYHPGLSMDQHAYQHVWQSVLDGQERFLVSLVHERLRQIHMSIYQEDVHARTLHGTHARMAAWYKSITNTYALANSEHVRFGRLSQDARTELAYARRAWRDIDESQSMEHSRLWRLDPTEGPNRSRAKLQPVAPRPVPVQPESTQLAPAHQSELDELGDACADARTVRDADASAGGVTVTFDPDASVMHDAAPEPSQEAPQDTHQDDFEDKLRSVLLSLERGDIIERTYNISRVVGVDALGSLLVVGTNNIYMLDNFFQRPNGELVSITDAPPEERDTLVAATRSGGAAALSLAHTVEGDEPVRHWHWNAIQTVFRRAWLHRRTALELFFADGQSTLIVLSDSSLAAEVHSVFRDKAPSAVAAADELAEGIRESGTIPQKLANTRITGAVFRRAQGAAGHLTSAWSAGEISNARYLVLLNTLAGRTFNDLTQFPVFPWVLADYTAQALDLDDPKSFRDLTRPMGAQTKHRHAEFEERYAQLEEVGIDPFHYGTHYSTASSACSFLVRMLPYADILVELQGGSFDLADRTFSSIGRAWYSASELSRGDVRELIPEFFTLPEMFENPNGFHFGVTQGGTRVDRVELPPWAFDDPVLFVHRHREALESPYVNAHLHEWIDLIFGYKAHGTEAIRATNVFHPLSYADGIDLEAIESPLEREAAAQVIHNFGQTPRTLFSRPHPAKVPASASLPWSASAHLADHVNYLTRSAAPVHAAAGPVAQIYGNPPEHAVRKNTVVFSNAGLCVNTGFVDRSVRVSRLGEPGHRFVAMLEQATLTGETVLAAVGEARVLVGSRDGMVQIFSIVPGPSLVLDCVFTRHTDGTSVLTSDPVCRGFRSLECTSHWICRSHCDNLGFEPPPRSPYSDRL